MVPRSVTPVPGGNAGELSAASKMLITSTRSLSVSFQGEAFSLPISKKKEASTPTLHRKSTPERRRATPVRDHGENSKPMEQQRWPGRSRSGSLASNPLMRSLDYGGEGRKPSGFGSGMVVKSLQHSMIDESRRLSLDGRLSLDVSNGEDFLSTKQNPDAISANDLASSVSCDLTASDTDSVSSGSTNGVPECGISKGKTGARGILVSARFWQETNSRLRRLQEPGSPLSTSPISRMAVPSSKLSQSKRFSTDGPVLSPRTMASPIRGATRPASPSKLWTSSTSSPARGIPSPSRARAGSSQMGNCNSSPSILSFSVDIRRGKIGEDRILDAHMLRLLYNRYLQWRFVNARADATCMLQRLGAEKNLWNAWVTMSELRHSVTLKRIKLLLLRQKLKLTSILRGQMVYLEEWALLDRDHSSSLSGATEALRASTLRLPVVGKATADIQNLKDAVGSAVDVMQAMASSICLLSSKAEETNSVMAELVNVTAKEKIMLEQCKDFLSTLAAIQVKDCSLRTHVLQLSRVSSNGSLTTPV
ncbi:QWRF motif-containing protein 2 [Carica papaya]|uniref:QWRF motif-containing protein 2 n=1 Tax=Carica papaya TaxID=3649 RepID=UPI000B8D0045|nr:QWRF motif-containing protein 2 [Carica papaya]